MKISVVTLTYKNFGHLKETILSVLNQNHDGIEYIICDDHSPDFPEDQIRQLIEQNRRSNLISYKILRQEKNVGTVKNINYAYSKASGDYVINLSCGDIFFNNNVLCEITNAITESKKQMVLTSRIMYENDFEPVTITPHINDRKRIKSLVNKESQYKEFIRSNIYGIASGSVMCTSVQALKELNFFDEKYVLWEDGPFIEKFLNRYSIGLFPEIISIWYEKGGISTGGMPSKHSKLHDDFLLYNKTQKMRLFRSMSFFERRWVSFVNERAINAYSNKKYITFLKYLPETIILIYQRVKEKKYCKMDKRFLDQIIIKNNRG